MTTCLEKIKEAYKGLLNDMEMEDIYKSLSFQKEQALDTGANLAAELNRFAEQKIVDREARLKAEQLQQVIETQGAITGMRQVKAFQEKGIKNPFERAVFARIGGTQLKIEGARNSTELKMKRAMITTYHQVATFLHDNNLEAIWNTKQHQVEIADAILKAHQGKLSEIANPKFRQIGEFFKNMQDKSLDLARSVGIYINKLDDRVAPNIHSQTKMQTITRAERKILKERNMTPYAFARERWKDYVTPLLDKERTFTKNNVDFNDKKAVSHFLDHVFDQLNDQGLTMQKRMNVGKRMMQPRILHWADAESLVKYNDRFGTGALQDSIMRDLAFNRGRIEYIKDWGVNGQKTLNMMFEMANEDPTLKHGFGKAQSQERMRSILSALTRTNAEYAGTLGEFARNLRAFETITKLGMVTVRSIPDLGLLAMEASRHNMYGFQAIGEAVKNLFFGMSRAEQEALKDLLEVGIQHQIGSIAKYDIDANNPSTLLDKGVRLTMKLNMLERWDYSMRSTALSIVSRRLGQMKQMSWEQLGEENQSRLGLYNIERPDWEAMRQAANKMVGNKNFLTPDAVRYLPDNVLRESLKEKGAKQINDVRLSNYRDELESKLRDYFQDRQEHVILRPGVVDEDLLTLGKYGLGMPNNDAGRQVIKLFTQFKLYSVAYARTPLAQVFYGKGARSLFEATMGGKGDYQGMVKLISYMMALKYASMTVDNYLNGLSAPGFDKADTWYKMLAEGAGIYGLALGIDWNDPTTSIAKNFIGAGLTDIGKAATTSYDFLNDTRKQFLSSEGGDYSKTWKDIDKLTRGMIPKYPYSALIMNNLLLNDWEDYTNPGARERYLGQLYQKTGSEPL